MQKKQNNKTAEKESEAFNKQMKDAYKEFMKVHFDESVTCEECKEKYLK